ncbi:hypothetical protein P7K49_000845 [Saguinus oedipus]|uniref:Uncharacterized protein n=1 Tax=Saguinus oedipus TaxID=9490 RepID=A0ABQ9WCT2_SAGOE|nr:hypothetical protein P7K49_000845 [Saguinus oedipus]
MHEGSAHIPIHTTGTLGNTQAEGKKTPHEETPEHRDSHPEQKALGKSSTDAMESSAFREIPESDKDKERKTKCPKGEEQRNGGVVTPLDQMSPTSDEELGGTSQSSSLTKTRQTVGEEVFSVT